MKLLFLCGALAAGEYLAACVHNFADAWPVAAGAMVLVALLGYGLSVRGWPFLCAFLTGLSLFLVASTAEEQLFRERPWMRERRARHSAPSKTVGFAVSVKRDFARRLAIGLEEDQETVSLVRAVLLGERWRISPRMKRLFVDSGTMHVFAISGLHVMSVANVLTVLLATCLFPRRLVGLVVVPLLWGYVYLIGLPPSAVRAALMATFSCFAPVFWKRPNGLRSWSLTFLLVHLACPRLIVDVGNALSFVVMLAIVLTGDYVRDLAKWKQSLAITAAAWAVGVPISAHVFGRVTPGGLLANLVLIMAAKLVVVSGMVGLLSTYLSTTVANHMNNLCALTIQIMVYVADVVSRIPGANLETGKWTISVCIGWYVLLCLIAFGAMQMVRRRAFW